MSPKKQALIPTFTARKSTQGGRGGSSKPVEPASGLQHKARKGTGGSRGGSAAPLGRPAGPASVPQHKARKGTGGSRGGSAAPLDHPLLGRVVKKDFSGEPFLGTVTAFDRETGWLRVDYEDGDCEELEEGELRSLLCPTPYSGSWAFGAAAQAAAPAAAAPAAALPPQPQRGTKRKEPAPDADGGTQGAASPKGKMARAAQQASGAAAAPKDRISKRVTLPPSAGLAGPLPRPTGKKAAAAAAAAAVASSPERAKPWSKKKAAAAAEAEAAAAVASPPERAKPWSKKKAAAAAAAAAGAAPSGPAKPLSKKAAAAAGAAPSGPAKPLSKKAAAAAGAAAAEGGKADGRCKSGRREPPTLEELPVREGQRYAWPKGEEPWRALPELAVAVNEAPVLDAESCRTIHDCKQRYYRRYRQAEEEEDARLAAAGGVGARGQRLSRRPDRVTESWMKRSGQSVFQENISGFVPGVPIGQRFYARAELGCVGMHRPPVAGIDYCGVGRGGKGVPSFAVSVVVSGWYQDDDDEDEQQAGAGPAAPAAAAAGAARPPAAAGPSAAAKGGDEDEALPAASTPEEEDGAGAAAFGAGADALWFTGQGGNDLLGTRLQHKDQIMELGNLALVGNIALGLPVRVVRKNKDPDGIYGCCLIFDGLYDVVEYRCVLGKTGFKIYRYHLVRRQGQGPLLSQSVKFGGMSAPRSLTPLTRPGVVDTDISGGMERVPIAAVNETGDEDLPPCTALERVPDPSSLKGVLRGIGAPALAALQQAGWRPTVTYVTDYRLTEGVAAPAPAVLPPEFQGRPHDYLLQLNHGHLPYLQSRGGKLLQLYRPMPIVYECGPWANCALGAACPQAATQGGSRYRLEVFKTTDGRGWGVRSLDLIPAYSYVATYFGEVFTTDAYDQLTEEGGAGAGSSSPGGGRARDASYSMDMCRRPDLDWQGNEVKGVDSADLAKHVICGLRYRNVAAFFNHSCAPNCFVQPVLSGHHDADMPRIAVFAAEDIAPFTQLTWDYGTAFARSFEGGCGCGAAQCIRLQPPEATAPAAAPEPAEGPAPPRKAAGQGAAAAAAQQQQEEARQPPPPPQQQEEERQLPPQPPAAAVQQHEQRQQEGAASALQEHPAGQPERAQEGAAAPLLRPLPGPAPPEDQWGSIAEVPLDQNI